ncbi:conserved hypothetical protein [Ricinus communis]|uniref:Uncharacterized protein n=1 Tax=Ricinus communis TaxID=3988 RepID=B9RQH0_RICCO|nr:conserved hypothetical protein [Ricinus communis]
MEFVWPFFVVAADLYSPFPVSPVNFNLKAKWLNGALDKDFTLTPKLKSSLKLLRRRCTLAISFLEIYKESFTNESNKNPHHNFPTDKVREYFQLHSVPLSKNLQQ